MEARSEAFARQFETKAEEAIAALQRLSDAVVRAIVAGRSLAGFGLDRMDAQNAQYAKDHAACTKAETIERYDEHFGSIRQTVGRA
jgi:hypothetical protein